MKSTLAVLLVLITLGVFAQETQEYDPMEYVVGRFMDKPFESLADEAKKLDAKTRREYINWAWYGLQSSQKPEISSYRFLLFFLGDEQIVNEVVKQYLDGTETSWSGTLIFAARDPHYIEMMAPLMFVDDQFKATRTARYESRSVATASNIQYLLQIIPGFSPDVVKWAHRSLGWTELTGEQRRQLFRDWYKENEVHFKARNYQAVGPGRDLGEPETSVVNHLTAPPERSFNRLKMQWEDRMGNPIGPPVPLPTKSTGTPSGLPSTLPPVSTPLPAAPEPQRDQQAVPRNTLAWRALILGVGVATVAALWLWLRRRE